MLCKKSLALTRAQICSMAQDFPVAFSSSPSYCCSCPAPFSPCNCCHQKTVNRQATAAASPTQPLSLSNKNRV
ncbi:uncharacterized [Tachysurus ichikawai]